MVVYASMIFVIMAFAGLSVDVGYLQFQKRKMQAAADAAAMGALREMERNNTDLVAAGQNDASLNGFTNGVSGTVVTISNPPVSGSFAGDSSAVQATVSRRIPTYFMRAMGQTGVTVSSTAVARTSTTEGSVGGCIFAMNSSASGALTINGSVVITSACGAVVNSNSSSALTMGGGSLFNLANGAQIGVVGPGAGSGWSINNNASIVNMATNALETPVNIVSFTDPLANASAPTPTGLSVQTQNGWSDNQNQVHTINPGIYCGGMNVKGTLNLNPGTYVLAGGGMTINSQAVVSGSGVMFYNTTSNSQAWGCNGSSSAGSFTFNGGATINLSASTTQTPVGILFFDDRNLSGLTHTINGNSYSTYDGAQYFLHSYLKFAGTNQTPGYTYIVADTITITGNTNLGNDHSTLVSVNELAPASTGGGLVQ